MRDACAFFWRSTAAKYRARTTSSLRTLHYMLQHHDEVPVLCECTVYYKLFALCLNHITGAPNSKMVFSGVLCFVCFLAVAVIVHETWTQASRTRVEYHNQSVLSQPIVYNHEHNAWSNYWIECFRRIQQWGSGGVWAKARRVGSSLRRRLHQKCRLL